MLAFLLESNLVLVCYMLWPNIWCMESLDSLSKFAYKCREYRVHMLTITIRQLVDDVIALWCCWSQYVLVFMGHWLNLWCENLWDSLWIISFSRSTWNLWSRPPAAVMFRSSCERLLVHAAEATLWSHMLWRTPPGVRSRLMWGVCSSVCYPW